MACLIIHDLDVSLETSLLWNYKTKIGDTGSFSDTEFCPLSAVMGGEDYLYNVTLVSNDNQQVSAHKLVLSSYSE